MQTTVPEEPVKMTIDADNISVVIPCFNCANTLGRAIESIQHQSLAVSQIVLVDDCSTDSTRDVMVSLAKEDGRIECVNLAENSGPSRARNVGLEAATGAFVTFLDADDAWHPEKIKLQLHAFEVDPDLVITGHLCDVAEEGTPFGDLAGLDMDIADVIQPISRRSVLFSNPWSTPTVMLRNTVPHRFDEDQRMAEDYLLWAQIILGGRKGVRITLPLARLFKARFGDGGLSGNLWAMEKGELITYWKLLRRGYLPVWQFPFVVVYSLAKYLRRVAVTK